MSDPLVNPAVQLQISFRGKKHDYPLNLDTLVADVKNHLVSCVDGDMEPNDFKIIHKGKVLSDDSANILNTSSDAPTTEGARVLLNK